MRAVGWSIWGLTALAVTLAAALGAHSVWPSHWSRADYGEAEGSAALAVWVVQGLLCVPFLFLSALVGLRVLTWFSPAVGLGVTLGHYATFTGAPWVGALAVLWGTLYLSRWRRLLPVHAAVPGVGLLLAWGMASALVLAHAPAANAEVAAPIILVRGACLALQGALLVAPLLAPLAGREVVASESVSTWE
ncbi:MAG: hypothetical protein L0Y66_17080 [Myxococcaceae bacterium]|nr:hypothetical protein [Myxococcaceae bacterium]MCI0672415.1 hypothetical protein [Myxococcaceae bacterium]